MVDCADAMLRAWVGWRVDRVRRLGYPHAAAFLREGGRSGKPSAPDIKVGCARVDAAVQWLIVLERELAEVVLAHYLSAVAVEVKCRWLGIGRNCYYDRLDRAQRLILRYVAEDKRNRA